MNEKKAKILRVMTRAAMHEVEGTAYLVRRHQKYVAQSAANPDGIAVTLQRVVSPKCARGHYRALKRIATKRGAHGARLYW